MDSNSKTGDYQILNHTLQFDAAQYKVSYHKTQQK